MLVVVHGVVPRVGGDVSLPWFQVLGTPDYMLDRRLIFPLISFCKDSKLQ